MAKTGPSWWAGTLLGENGSADRREREDVARWWAEVNARNRARTTGATCAYCGAPWRPGESWAYELLGEPTHQDTRPHSHIACYDRANPDSIWMASTPAPACAARGPGE